MRKLICVLTFVSLVFITANAYAVPDLQLNIPGGLYVDDFEGDGSTGGPFDQGIVTNAGSFNLQAFLKASQDANIAAQTYYISTALLNSDGTAAGSSSLIPGISINGTALSSSSWVYGTPDLLGPHGVFPTYYYPLSFNFSTGEYTPNGIFNVADGTGTAGGYIHNLNIDIDSIGDNQALVFDLYAYETKNNGDTKIVFAPFSHNATYHTPEPASLSLLGLGLLGLFGFRRKKQ